MNASLFVLTSLIWGTTWIAIAMQAGPVSPIVSIFYRFGSAALILLTFLFVTGRLRIPARRHHPFILAQALCLNCFNFICFYIAAGFMPTGPIAVVFSLAVVFNAINARLFFGETIRPRALVAGALGASGVALLFAQDLLTFADARKLQGVGLSLLGTMFFSLGNMAARRNSAADLSPVVSNGLAMAYGSIALFALVVATGAPIVLPREPRYLAALVYLSIFGTVIGFTTYLMMVQRMGSGKAAYLTIVTPVVALTVSTIFEDYRWTWTSALGASLALAGSLVMFAGRKA